MKFNTLTALHVESPCDDDILSKVLLTVQDDAQTGAEEYVKSAKVDLGGE